MNFSDKTFESLAPFERYFRTACDADWCPNPGRAALDTMAAALTEKDGRRTAINHACGSCILRVVKRTGYLWFEDKAERKAAEANGEAARAQREAAAAPETPKPTKTPAKKKTASTAKKTTKK
ncbi:MAG: hypothetical protein J6V72_10380 [Kiritimatiellae bacterium]|nr:hypothetical protein [Kiritimatiellia bacterium]